MVGTLEVDTSESRINDHSVVGFITCSLTEVRKRLCDDKVRINGDK